MISFLRALSLTGLPILVFVACTEYFWRKKQFHNLITRKFIHITVGTYAAFWPWFISWRNIELLAGGALCALIVSHLFKVFQTMHLDRQFGSGEFLSAVSLGLLALITHSDWIFAIAMLHLSLGDGLAAVFGTKLGKGNLYSVFGHKKSLAGTGAFFICSFVLLVIYLLLTHGSGGWLILAWLPLLATGLENIGVYGTDNLLVPLAVALILRALA
jgi:phytol kinase